MFVVLHGSLAATGFVVATVLAIAWWTFGHVRHLLFWAIGFGLTGIMSLVETGLRLMGYQSPWGAAALAAVAGAAVAFSTMGFRTRIGQPNPALLFGGAMIAQPVLTLVLAGLSLPPDAILIPFHLHNAVMFFLASRTMIGRRQGERVVRLVAQTTLIFCSVVSLTLVVKPLVPSMPPIPGWLSEGTMMAVPTFVAGIGLFTIFLIAADVADRIRRMAQTDPLTGLLNRRGFEEAAAALVNHARAAGRKIALIVADIDHLKAVNDRYGHPAGDAVIRAFARMLRQELDRRDVVARTGGEEFTLLLADTDAQTACFAMQALRERIAADPVNAGVPVQLTASFGVTEVQRTDTALADTIDRADRALYRSKADGRNRVTLVP